MDASEKWMIFQFHTTPKHHPVHPTKRDVLPKPFLQIILAASAAFEYIPQTAATTFAFSYL